MHRVPKARPQNDVQEKQHLSPMWLQPPALKEAWGLEPGPQTRNCTEQREGEDVGLDQQLVREREGTGSS